MSLNSYRTRLKCPKSKNVNALKIPQGLQPCVKCLQVANLYNLVS